MRLSPRDQRVLDRVPDIQIIVFGVQGLELVSSLNPLGLACCRNLVGEGG